MGARRVPWLACALALGCSRAAVVGLVDDAPDASSADTGVPADARDGEAIDAAPPSPQQVVIDECLNDQPEGVGNATTAALLRGGAPDPSLRVLYPYAGTVFPRGLGAPELMWSGPGGDAVYVRLHNDALDYRACVRPDGPGRLTLPQTGWRAAEQAAAKSAAPLALELTVLAEERVSGPLVQDLTVAPGELGGSVYYMSYGSRVSAPATTSVLRVRAGGPAEPFIAALSCAGCHSASADGSVFTAYYNGSGGVFQIGPTGTANARMLPALPTGVELAAVVPDGSLYVAPAHPASLGPRAYTMASRESALYDAVTGLLVADSGLSTSAVTPAFSPDGTQFTYVDASVAAGRSIAVVDFSVAQRKASEPRVVFTDPKRYPGWPSFVPDRSGIVFALGERSDLSGNGLGLVTVVIGPGPRSDLYGLGTGAGDAGTAGMLTRAMGFDSAEDAAAERTYLPFGAEEAHQNYNPSVSPIAAGGYSWVLFDSYRHYGNRGSARQIWVAAIDAARAGTFDAARSHPAFHLPGQELAAGNIRPVLGPDPP